MTSYDVLIVGGGHGGAQAAIALRQRKFEGSIAIVGEETELPYERPPLSKEFLAGEKPFERILIRKEEFWAERDIAMLLGREVVAVDPESKRVTLSDGGQIGYGALIWATGGKPRALICPGHDVRGVHSIRSRADIERLKSELDQTRKVVVIGGGYIGLEGAAVLAKMGKAVTVLEAQDRVLARVAGEPLSRFFEAEHRSHGVEVRLGAAVDCIEESDGAATGVRLADGEVLDCQMVIVGIGIIPSIAPLAAAGANVANGLLIDENCRTSLDDIYAVGDCAAHANAFADGATIRLESVQNANDQATTVAKALTGQPEAYHAVPWFWSNQYDIKLQTVGLSSGHDKVIVRGTPADRSFSLIYLKQGRVIALDCVNAVKDYVQGRALVEAGAGPDASQLADPDVPLKSLV